MQFTIENKPFIYDIDYSSNEFTVQSSPHNYRVIYTDAINLPKQNAVLLIDANVYTRHPINFPTEKTLIFEANENTKTLDGVTVVLNFLQKNAVTKSDQLIIIGGGITQEVGAFAAKIYKRGIPWIFFPTTLLAMCDSCIGGKAGINFGDAKNQLGLFSTPNKIFVYLDFLKTLDADAIHSGLGEILKLSIIAGGDALATYERRAKDESHYKELILTAQHIKKSIVEVDEFESNYRRSMNVGHTLGHAIESLSNFTIPHGQAIVVGMILENTLSFQWGLLNQKDLKTLNALCFELLSEKIISIVKNISLDNILSLIQKDKKTTGNYAHFALIKRPGDVCFVKIKIDERLVAMINNEITDYIPELQ